MRDTKHKLEKNQRTLVVMNSFLLIFVVLGIYFQINDVNYKTYNGVKVEVPLNSDAEAFVIAETLPVVNQFKKDNRDWSVRVDFMPIGTVSVNDSIQDYNKYEVNYISREKVLNVIINADKGEIVKVE